MIKKLFIILFLLKSITEIGCNERRNNIQSVTLKFDSFKSPYTTFTLNFATNILTCKNFGDDPKFLEKTNVVIPIFEKNYIVNAKSSRELKELFETYIPDTLTHHLIPFDADGGGFEIFYIRHIKDTAKLIVENPIRNDIFKTDLLQLDKFMEVAYASVLDSMGINTIDESYEQYYPGLPIRKTSEQPLTYKVWGNFSGCREDNKDLLNFLDSISTKPCVLIEVDNFKLSYCLTEVIAEYSLKENMHFLSFNDLPSLWDGMNDLRTQVIAAKKRKITLAETPGNAVLLDTYLADSMIFNKWLNIPKDKLFKTRSALKQSCR